MASMLRMSIVNTSAGMLSMLAGFASSIIVARTLGVEGTGTVAYALWFMTVATLVSDLGMPQAALRFIARDTAGGQGRSPLFRQLFFRFLAASSLMTLAIIGYALVLARQDNAPGAFVWAVTSVLFLSYAYSTLVIGAAQGLGQFDRAARMTLTGCLLQPVVVLAGALALGPAGAILGHAVRHLPQALDLKRYLGPAGSGTETGAAPSVPLTQEIRRYARNNWISGSILALFGVRIELAIIGFFFTLTQVGYYAIGLTMSGMVVQLSLFIVAFVIPRFGVLHDQADDEAFRKAFDGTVRWLTIVIAPITIGGAAIAPELIPLVFGADFLPAVWPASVLLIFSIPMALSAVISRAILAKNRSRDELRMTFAWCAVTIAALLAVIPASGQMGAAWVRGGANVLQLVILAVYCHRCFKLFLPLKTLLKSLIAAALCAAAAVIVLNTVSSPWNLPLAILAAAPVYLAALVMLRTVPVAELAPLVEVFKSRFGRNRAT